MCRVIRVSDRYLEVDGKLKIGEIVKAGNCLAVVVSVNGEVPEYLKYAGELNREEIERYMPDVLESRVTSKCFILGGDCISDIGDEVRVADDEEIREYHLKDGELRIPYFYQMLKSCDIDVAKSVMKRLKSIFKNEEILDALLREIDYMIMNGMK